MAEIASTCPYCGCGCGIYLHTEGGRVTGVAPSRSHPVSQGRLCLKGWHAHELMHNPARLTEPLLRRGDTLQKASWEDALAAAAAGLRGVAPANVGVVGSARAANEDNYALARFARWTLGTGNIDCSQRFQNPTQPASPDLTDLDRSDLVLVVGADPNQEHPAVSARIYRARQRGAKLIVASTRRHELGRIADAFLRVRPGAEAHLAAALLRAVLDQAKVDESACAGLTEVRTGLASATPEAAAVPADDLRRAAQLYADAEQVAIIFSPALAVTPAAEAAILALGDLAGLGEVGPLPKASLLALLGRNNLRGAREMGITPFALPGGLPLSATQDFALAWGGTVCGDRGLSVWGMLDGVQALYVMGDDVLRAAPDRAAAEAALSKVPFLIVQDLFLTPLCQYAQVVLPAAAFGERDGTYTNLEGRVQRIRRATSAPGQAREDWRIVCDLSRALGKSMPYQSAEAIFTEMAALLPPYERLSYEALDQPGGVRVATRSEPSQLQPVPLNGGVRTDEAHPFLIAADASLSPWDEEATIANTLTVAVEFTVTSKDFPAGLVALHPEDAKRLGVRPGRDVKVTSARGECKLRVQVTEETSEGVALMPYWQATRVPLLEVVACPGSGRPTLAPTPVSIAPA